MVVLCSHRIHAGCGVRVCVADRAARPRQSDALHPRHRNSRFGLCRTWHDALCDACRIRRMAALVLPSGLRGLHRDAALRSLLSRNGQSVAHVGGHLCAIGRARREFLGSPKLRFFEYRQPALRVTVRRAGIGDRRCRTARVAMVCSSELDSVDGISGGCRGSAMAEGREGRETQGASGRLGHRGSDVVSPSFTRSCWCSAFCRARCPTFRGSWAPC